MKVRIQKEIILIFYQLVGQYRDMARNAPPPKKKRNKKQSMSIYPNKKIILIRICEV